MQRATATPGLVRYASARASAAPLPHATGTGCAGCCAAFACYDPEPADDSKRAGRRRTVQLDKLSVDACDMLAALTRADPEMRPTAHACLQLPFVAEAAGTRTDGTGGKWRWQR